MPASNLTLLNDDTLVMAFVRVMEAVNFIALLTTVRVIHVKARSFCATNDEMFQAHSPKAMGSYKYCLLQIVLVTFIGQQLTWLGPIFVFPILGAYHYIDFTDNPHVIHSILCAWVTCCGVDILAILDGFAFRLQVLLASFYPQFADKRVWVCDLFELIIFFPFHKTFWQNYQIQISISVFGKLCVFGLIGFWLLPIGAQLSRDTMRQGLLKHYPNAVTTFDEYKSFVVYDVRHLTGKNKK
ncbi:hypothetical protein PRIPAC_76996 [Pristionchus pacificus]|uniref:Uncharacterized protein n=1 Tax=Pristionchus pacificus TaxID=54126 RepID=A0A2A6CMZ0_PRIPA|nr:hypothetical protein PRIPAC_76996 [Pristionchus pacificus]|eukprot:PDM79391.1 hypothetical protein PRIPAC_31970 [Pristionchus pacificus]